MSTLNSVEIGVCGINVITPYSITKQFFTKVWINEAVEIKAMIESGSAGNFISPATIEKYGLKTQMRDMPLSVTHVQGGLVGVVSEQVTCEMSLGTHRETLTLNVIPLGRHAIILGMPWLRVHNPNMDWETQKVTFNSEYCNRGCIGITQEEAEELEDMEIAAVSEKEKAIIPEEYHEKLGTFDIEKARALPPSRGEYDFKIDFIPDAKIPPPVKPYRLTPPQLEEARSQINELEASGMISKSTSRMAAPLFFVPKKDGRQHMCIDYRKLNEITVHDAYPLPNMESLLQAARGAKIFSKFDLCSAYNMFRVRPGDQWKTAFVMPWGLYEFNVMHYGFVNAPACLQQYMDHILAPLIYKVPAQVTVYMDDIGTFRKDTPDAIDLNTKVLTILERVQLYCKAEKCAFHKDQINLLGVTINSDGFGLEDKKVSDVRSWPVPTNLTALKGFIGFCNFYCRFLKNFSIVA